MVSACFGTHSKHIISPDPGTEEKRIGFRTQMGCENCSTEVYTDLCSAQRACWKMPADNFTVESSFIWACQARLKLSESKWSCSVSPSEAAFKQLLFFYPTSENRSNTSLVAHRRSRLRVKDPSAHALRCAPRPAWRSAAPVHRRSRA